MSLSYSHRILQGVLDFSLSQEHIPPAHPPKHALKSRDALPVNHTSHEAVGRRARLGNLFHARGWKALRQRGKWGEVRGWQTWLYIVMSKKLKFYFWSQKRVERPQSKSTEERLSTGSEESAFWKQVKANLLLFWTVKMNLTPLSMEGWSGTYPSLKGVPLPISLGSKRDEDSSNRSGSAICWWCNSAWIHKSINI